jgi:hypothetical protein
VALVRTNVPKDYIASTIKVKRIISFYKSHITSQKTAFFIVTTVTTYN